MQKVNLFAVALAILLSQTGCIGPKEEGNKDFAPYTTAEIQEKLAKSLNPEIQQVPANFFETFDYTNSDEQLNDSLSALNTKEEKQFWKTLFNLRRQMLLSVMMLAEDMDLLDEQLQNPDIKPEVLAAAASYESSHPFTPDLAEITQIRKNIIGMALASFPIPPSEEEVQKYIEQWGGLDAGKAIPKVREEILRYYNSAVTLRQQSQIPKNFEQTQKEKLGTAEYAVHMFGPELFPVELLGAYFMLSSDDESMQYTFPVMYFVNGESTNSIRIENEKPLPYKMYLMWYSITENKVYMLETQLPRETLKEKMLGDAPAWDALLVTIEPYGKATLYVYSQGRETKEKVAAYQANAQEIPFDSFQKDFAQYGDPSHPAADWKEYQQQAFTHFPQAAEIFKTKGRPLSDTNFWEKNPDNIHEWLPLAEEINTPDSEGFTPLINAIRHNKSSTVAALIKEGADVNFQTPRGETALNVAVDMNQAPFVRELIAAGADVNKRNTLSGQTPLIAAAMGGNNETVQLLLDAGADVNTRVQQLQENALSAALNNNHLQTAELLRQAGAEELSTEPVSAEAQQAAANAYAAMGYSPLHQAIIMADETKLKEAISVGADLNARDNTGLTPLMFAVQLGNETLTALLVNAGADVNATLFANGQDTGVTALQLAQNAELTKIAEILTNAGAK